MNIQPENVPSPPARKNRAWIVFFLMLAFLAAGGILLPVIYNLSLQLKVEDVAAAKELWQKEGPADYDMEYMTKIDRDEPMEFRVAVRSGRVQWLMTVSGPRGIVLASETYDGLGTVTGCAARVCCAQVEPADALTHDHTIDAFFSLIESKLRDDVAVGGKNYATAMFDRKDGHPLRYIHRVRGTSERLELNVRLIPLNQSEGP